ncbi:hypothetical protein [Nocardia sp. GTS18]|uniref:hypothetical protein n=1 Tax=Nocardia sp. GTS18 TaxID=1778064 RepID=UPI0015EF9301|nr:hypothetical protein [Nocardia sp. GTS18]
MTKSTTEHSGEDNELPTATANPAGSAGAGADRGDSPAPATPKGRVEPSPEAGPAAIAGPDTGRSEATPDAAPPGAKEQSGLGAATHHGADSGDSTANSVVPAIIAQAAATTALLSQKGNKPSDTAQSGDSDTATADSGADTTAQAREPVQSDSTPAPDRAAPNGPPGPLTKPTTPTTSPADRSASGTSTPPSWTSGWQAAAVEPMSPIRHTAAPPRPPTPPRWRRVARPSGVLPAAALVGVVGATVIPTDRPGIGWLLTGTAITAALWAVDQRARRSTTRMSERIPAAPEGRSANRDEKPAAAADTTTAPSVTGTRVAHDSPTEQTKAITPSMPATATPSARPDTSTSAAAESEADTNTAARASTEIPAGAGANAGTRPGDSADAGPIASAESGASPRGSVSPSINATPNPAAAASPATGAGGVTAPEVVAAGGDSGIAGAGAGFVGAGRCLVYTYDAADES